MYQNSLRIFRKIYGDNHPDIGTCCSNIGGVYGDLGDYFKALDMLQKGLNILLENFGENHPKVASNYSHIGSLYTKQGDYTKALEMYQKFMSINSKVYGEPHPFTTNYNRIGEIYYSAKAQGVELSGFKEFIQSVAFVGTTIGNDTPAFKKGLSGEYYVLELADWSMDSDTNLITKIVQLQSDPKTIVVMKENKISQFHFENTMGIGLSLRKVGVDEKQRIIKAYRKWKEKQQVQ